MYPAFGVGIGNFRWANKYYNDSFKPPHNSYLWAAVEGGVPVLLAYLLLFRLMWRRLGRLRDAYAERSDLPFFPHWLRVYMLLFLFFSFFADIWLEEHIVLILAAVVLLDRWRDRLPETTVSTPTEDSPGGDTVQRRLSPGSALAGAT
jgi:O-antigen ligase